jgi:hypothetical protein
MNKERQKSVAKYWNEESSIKRIEGWKTKTFKQIVEELMKSHPFIQIKSEMEILAPLVSDDQLEEFVTQRSEIVHDLVTEYLFDECTFKKVQRLGELALQNLTKVINQFDLWEEKPYENFNTRKVFKVNAHSGKIMDSSINKNDLQTEENFYEKELTF